MLEFQLGDKKIAGNLNANTTIPLEGLRMGTHDLIARIKSSDETYSTEMKIVIVADGPPKLYTYKVLESYPHDMQAYTQGLEFFGEGLYESTGKYGQSSIRRTDPQTGEVMQKVMLGDRYFGEGLTVMNDKVYQLTWRENIGYIYDRESLEQTGTFVYGESKEGWGLCNDGNKIYKSDGSERIWILDPDTMTEEEYIEIYTNKSKITNVNELEWVDGKIYANRYEKDAVAIVDPATGAVEGVIDMAGLKDQVTQHPELNVLNGIAYKGEPNILYVTGKNWDKLFKIEIVPK
jgi:glutamine cyclotransferase